MNKIEVKAPPRDGSSQKARSFVMQSMRGSFSWGVTPATAILTYISNGAAAVAAGSGVNFQIGRHYFAGICANDSEVNSSGGYLRVLEFQDMRRLLQYDSFFGAFNIYDVRMVGGKRLKRWRQMYPWDVGTYTWTFTDSPLNAWQILDAVLRAPTVFTKWSVNLTSNGMFPDGLLNLPIYGIEAQDGGMRLDAFLSLICEKTGLVFCHDPLPGLSSEKTGGLGVGPGHVGDFRLVFTRKGYGALPLPYPKNSDNRRLGVSLTENPTNICVVGDRNQYQVLEVPMIPDWSAAWQQFIDVDLLAKDLYDHEVNPLTGVAYNNYNAGNAGGDDPEHWRGAGDAKARALEITVAEYVALRNARSAGTGDDFADGRKFGGRWRMDMPAALYIEMLVFRAFRPDITGVENIEGDLVPLVSAEIADQLLARVYYDPQAGTMTTDIPPTPADGNGVLIAKGYQVGEDLFRLVQPDRMNADFFSAANRVWSQVGFQIDDSGEGVRFVIADAPVFVSDDLLATVDGKVVLNASATLGVPDLKAALVFRCEPYRYWRGNGILSSNGRLDPGRPLPGRNRIEPVGGLAMEFIVDAEGDYTEIPFANNRYADDEAQLIADSLLLNQPTYISGGYDLKWDPERLLKDFGTRLAPPTSTCFDRVDIVTGEREVMEVVDFTTERQRDRFEPERELDRRSLQNTLFPGQQELRQQALDQRRLNAVLRKTPAELFALFRKLLRGEVDGNLFPIKFVDGATLPPTLPAGTPLLRAAAATAATAPASVVAGTDTVFVGVTKRQNETTGGTFYVQHEGDTLARVMGPISANQPIGPSDLGGTDYATNGGYLKSAASGAVGIALEENTDKVADSLGRNPGDSGYVDTYKVKLIKVRLGAGGGDKTDFSIRGEYSPTVTYSLYEVAIISTGANTGTYVWINSTSGSGVHPSTGAPNWMQLPMGTVGGWL